MKVVSIFGTRPEAIKMAPLVAALAHAKNVESVVCVTGQHRQMLDQVMQIFGLEAHHDLAVMQPNQSLNGLFSRMISGVDHVLEQEKPDYVLVHGDTSTATASAIAAFHRRIAIGHVEAGLRTGNLFQPFPEEMNRRVVDVMSDWMFAPTPTSRANLQKENLQGRIAVTGNTVIDALAVLCAKLDADQALNAEIESRFSWVDSTRRLLLVTGHRRENFGEGFQQICASLSYLANRHPDLQIVYPVHLNPAVRDVVNATLAGIENIHLIEPLGYVDFVWFMRKSHIILTDSGGVQEEAPYLGKPVLVMRDVTERPEAVAAGTVLLVGTKKEKIISSVENLLKDENYYASFARCVNPYGDGKASERIVSALCGLPFQEFLSRSDEIENKKNIQFPESQMG